MQTRATKFAARGAINGAARAGGGGALAKESGADASKFIDAPERDAGPPNLPVPDFNTEAYDHIADNPFLRVDQNPLSTFSIDVDTGSYANVRRFLTNGQLPPKDAVRIEELLNYFPYDYPQPAGDDPFSVNVEVAPAPWNPEHKIARIGLKGRELAAHDRPACNLVFLLDVSGSMDEPAKLPLVKELMKMLVPKLNERDRVAIVVYAGASGLVLPSTEATKRNEILRAIDELRPGGSTNGAAGIQLAYDIAKANFIKGGVNRVILATDGDFNVGTTNQGALVRLVEEKAKSGVFLTVLGFGMGNLKDAMLEKLADKGNGIYGYIDTKKEAEKTFVEQIGGTLVTIAKDVKIQIEFNPAQVGAFRLIGYENRILRHEDFNDDKKDAGEIGAGHTVTALYELVPAGTDTRLPGVDALKYQKPSAPVAERESASSELMTVKLRYKQPDGDTSKLLQQAVADIAKDATPSKDLQFAAAVAEFGMVLRESPHKGNATFETALSLCEHGLGADPHGYRREFMDLVRKAKSLMDNQ
ncbi:MAG: VWA domain-containing protein [Verrucomicrobiota bacterium]|nr:VWA domain-containing protein [Verrucomicrobiota bacterium]